MYNFRERFNQIKSFNWRLFTALCLWSLIPAVYQTIRTFIISTNNDSAVFDIIGQIEWFDLINETLLAFLIIPLYSVLNKIYVQNNKQFSKYTFKTGLIAFILYSIFSIAILIHCANLIRAMNPDSVDISVMNRYLQLETIAFMVNIIVSFVNVVFVVIGKGRNIYIILAIKTIFSIIADFILIPNIGVYGVAISNIIANVILAGASFIILYLQKLIQPCGLDKTDLPILKEWWKTGMFSGIQQFIDNFFYAIMICKMVNMVAEQGNYWIANNFIWGWLLIPVAALGEVIRGDCKDGYSKLRHFNYYFIILVVVCLWFLTIPLWLPFYRYAEQLTNAHEIFLITIKLVPFYIAYAISAIIDNIFIGLGKTAYNAVNSIIVNLIYYGVLFILYITNVIVFTMDMIILMFGFGMVFHLIISIIEEKFLRKQELKKYPI